MQRVPFEVDKILSSYINSKPGTKVYNDIYKSIHIKQNQILTRGLNITDIRVCYGSAIYQNKSFEELCIDRIKTQNIKPTNSEDCVHKGMD